MSTFSEQKTNFAVKFNEKSSVKKVVGVLSGKGGVGKSLVSSMLAVQMRRRGYEVGILDADVTGPSIPKAFGLTQQAGGDEQGVVPVASKTGIKVMSINLLLPNATDPVIWRGPPGWSRSTASMSGPRWMQSTHPSALLLLGQPLQRRSRPFWQLSGNTRQESKEGLRDPRIRRAPLPRAIRGCQYTAGCVRIR